MKLFDLDLFLKKSLKLCVLDAPEIADFPDGCFYVGSLYLSESSIGTDICKTCVSYSFMFGSTKMG